MSLVFKNICHDYGDQAVLKDISLAAHSGEILCLLGPSGCGKTTLLNLAAGILELQSGTITLDGNELASPQNCPPPEKRSIGLVFQDGALFPHMTVGDNVEFGIFKRPDRGDISSKLLEQVGLSDLKKRFPHSLSGGQQQRVAVARSLAPEPRVILMDEPFANIDIVLRRRLREEIRGVLKSQNCITIMVTHDPEEAMEISDKVAVMLGGQITQIGRPKDIYQNPISSEVARLTSEGVVVPAVLDNGNLKTEFGDWPAGSVLNSSTNPENEKLNLFIRPFAIDVECDSTERSSLQVTEIRHTGPAQMIAISSPSGSFLNLQIAAESDFKVGQRVNLYPKKDSLLAFSS